MKFFSVMLVVDSGSFPLEHYFEYKFIKFEVSLGAANHSPDQSIGQLVELVIFSFSIQSQRL